MCGLGIGMIPEKVKLVKNSKVCSRHYSGLSDDKKNRRAKAPHYSAEWRLKFAETKTEALCLPAQERNSPIQIVQKSSGQSTMQLIQAKINTKFARHRII